MAPIEIEFNRKTKDIDQKIAVLSDGEKKVFHFEKPLHRAFSVECNENQPEKSVVGKVNTWSTVPHISATPPPGEDIRIPNVPMGHDVIFRNGSIRIDLGKGIVAKISHKP